MNKLFINTMYITSNYIMNVTCLYFFYKLLEKREKLTSKKNTFLALIMTITAAVLNFCFGQPIKLLLSFVFLLIIGYIITNRKIAESFILIITLQINIIISEMIFSGVINLLFSNTYNEVIVTFSNYCVAAFLLLLIKTKIPKSLFDNLRKSKNIINYKEIIIYSIMIIFIIIISIVESYMNFPVSVVIITNTVMALVLITIIIKFVTTKSNYQLISNKYQTSITSLKEYETMIDKFRVNTHENKNELLTIRNMIKSNDKKTVEYIDKLVDNKIKDNEKIMYQTSKIPEGGLRATIYSKLCVMDKYKIKCKLDISKDVRTVDLINLDEELILNICKILGVFMDNAIEEVIKLKKRNISIELYVIDNCLYIDITNNFKGNIDMSSIGKEKQTTKGEKHGYGLLLVKKIINENSKYLENEKSINGNNFTQTLIIKI